MPLVLEILPFACHLSPSVYQICGQQYCLTGAFHLARARAWHQDLTLQADCLHQALGYCMIELVLDQLSEQIQQREPPFPLPPVPYKSNRTCFRQAAPLCHWPVSNCERVCICRAPFQTYVLSHTYVWSSNSAPQSKTSTNAPQNRTSTSAPQNRTSTSAPQNR